ncbi:copper P-type ATPase CtaA [Sistotremastrum suecicum HHB10207 ss-3]|uniref:P-type Cu(+) transporter n=1 Tax=Sistotremastrum suecicum HHB10207 ss-3 TaxID=1314776 RepID=A0A166EB13_9AGAM|nr:copper P-type ATPase CtaA [Sistotremastrum suecicum HHB10207 ss-3]
MLDPEPTSLDGAQQDGEEGKCELRVEGMTCGSCVESIESMLRNQPGIHSIKVALLAERAVVEYDTSLWNVEKLVSEISDIGFDATHIPPASSDTVVLRIYGMTCDSCSSNIQTGLLSMPGIKSASVSEVTGIGRFEFDRTMIGPREMVERIEDMGYNAVLSDHQDATQIQSLTRTKEIQEWRHKFITSVAFAVPVFIISMCMPMASITRPFVDFKLANGIYVGDTLCLFLTIPVQFWVGKRFYRNAYKSLKHGTATMDVLVVLGTTAAFVYSVFAMFFAFIGDEAEYHPTVFFDTSTMLITFVSLGRYLENLAKGKTSAALTDLMALAPSMATIYTDAPTCTQERRVPTELVQVGDTVKIVPGDKIPADGTVVKGTSSVDESAVTGEPIPVLKQQGDAVIGGTVNGLGTFDMVVTRAGKDTALAQIVKLVEEAQTSKAPIQAFADRVAGYFVPAVISLAAATFVAWMVVAHVLPDTALPAVFHHTGSSKLAVCLKLCISVVVVACPCALGLSTPTAIMVGSGVGAKNGILIKGGRALEASKNIKRIVLDKTGTVTDGKLKLVSVAWASTHDSYDPEKTPRSEGPLALSTLSADGKTTRAAVLAMVAAAEARSEHPLAKAIAVYGKETLLKLGPSVPEVTIDSFESVTGAGVKAHVTLPSNGTIGSASTSYEIYIGTSSFVSDRDLPPTLADFEDSHTSQARTVIFASISSSGRRVPVLAMALADEPKKSSAAAIRALQAMGIDVHLMTGDSEATARAVAKQVGIHPDAVWPRMSPQGKAKVITEMIEKEGPVVAMVGDGINDSPALVASTVGIALSSGTSVAIEAADVVLMRSDLLDVVAALNLSRAIYKVIRRNLVWACIYNVIGIPLAMGLFLPWGLHLHPMMAGAAMAFSSVSVVTSSLTLKWWRRPDDSLMDGEVLQHETMWDSAKIALADAWDGVRDFARGTSGRRAMGYSEVPVEMSSRV